MLPVQPLPGNGGRRGRAAGFAVSVSGRFLGRVSGRVPRDTRRHRSLEGSWEGLRVSAVRPRPFPSSRPACRGPGRVFPRASFPSRESFPCPRFRCWLKSRAVKPEMKQLPPRSSSVLTETVTKPHPKGKFPCPARCAGRRGRDPALSWDNRCAGLVCAQCGSVTELRRGSGAHFPASQVPFPPAVPNSRLCSQIWESVWGEVFQISTPRSLGGGRRCGWMVHVKLHWSNPLREEQR